jgi:hypothetical protein
MASERLARAHAEISDHLEAIAGLFVGGTPMITLVVRTPWIADGGVLLTNDTTDEAVAEIQRLAARAAVVIPASGGPHG